MPDSHTPKPTLFLDRDGVVNIDKNYVFRIQDFDWVEGAKHLIKRANQENWWVVIVTNQSGVGRGFYNETDIKTLHAWMQTQLATGGARIDAFYYSPFHEDALTQTYKRESLNRKPAPGMLYRAQMDFAIDIDNSIMFGDKAADIQAAQSAGVKGYLFKGGNIFDFASNYVNFDQTSHAALKSI